MKPKKNESLIMSEKNGVMSDPGPETHLKQQKQIKKGERIDKF